MIVSVSATAAPATRVGRHRGVIFNDLLLAAPYPTLARQRAKGFVCLVLMDTQWFRIGDRHTTWITP